MECGGIGALPPVTLFEITLGKGLDEDYYDVSLVDGYNLPVVAAPRVRHGGCNATGCLADLNRGKTPCLFPLPYSRNLQVIIISESRKHHKFNDNKKATTKARS